MWKFKVIAQGALLQITLHHRTLSGIARDEPYGGGCRDEFSDSLLDVLH